MTKLPYEYHTDGTHDFIAMFTIDTIVSDASEHASRGVQYTMICERLFRNTQGVVIATNPCGYQLFYRHVPVPYYGVGTYDAALANYYETYVTFPYPTQCGGEVIITVRFTVDHDRLNAAEEVFKSMAQNGLCTNAFLEPMAQLYYSDGDFTNSGTEYGGGDQTSGDTPGVNYCQDCYYDGDDHCYRADLDDELVEYTP